MEKEFSILPIGIKYICDFCENGEMLPSGKNDWSLEQPKFEHECSNCGKKIYLMKNIR